MNHTMEQIFCTASNKSDSNQAVAILPHPIDLTKRDYEISLIYSSVVASWIYTDELWMISSSDENDTSTLVRFEQIPYTKENEAMHIMSSQLSEKYGDNMKSAPAKILKAKSGAWFLRLPKKSMVHLSDGLSYILSLPNIIHNSDDTVKDFTINFQIYAPYLEERLFYISCNESEQNFVTSDSSSNRILDFIHTPDPDPYIITAYNTSRIGYVKLEGSILHRVSFKILDYLGNHISLDKFNFFVFFHIRPR